MQKISEPFAPRPTHFREIFEYNGWRFKVYKIIYGTSPLDWQQYQQAIEIASKEFPQPTVTDKRPGVGFIICHQGRGWHYLVVCWWDNENELITKILVQKIDEKNKWQKATSVQSICVWDLEIIWFERNAYVGTVLSNSDSPDIETYLKSHFTAK